MTTDDAECSGRPNEATTPENKKNPSYCFGWSKSESAWDNWHLFPNLKRWFQEKRFYSNEDVEFETDSYFELLDKSYYLKGIEMLEERWTKCIGLEGDYVEE